MRLCISPTTAHMNINILFSHFAEKAAHYSGRSVSFMIATLLIVTWALSGHFFHYSDTWQLVINTATTIITFLMVFLIQNTQNREARAVQLKLDELIRSTEGAHTRLINLEELTESELEAVREKYISLARDARLQVEQGKSDAHIPEIAF